MGTIEGNPRDYFAEHRERGPKRFEYTYQEIAAAAKQSLATVRSQVKGTFAGLRRVALYVARGLGRQAQRLDEGELKVLFGEDYPKWEQRWPRFDLYHCANPECPIVIFHRGLCHRCGGPSPAPIAFDSNSYVAVYLDGHYVPWHQLVFQPHPGETTHHLDLNKWNNRVANLGSFPWSEHRRLHHRRKDDHVPLPSILASHPSVEKASLTTKKAHDTVGAATDAAAVPLGGEHEP